MRILVRRQAPTQIAKPTIDPIICNRSVDTMIKRIGEDRITDLSETSGPFGYDNSAYSCGFDFRSRKVKESLREEGWDTPLIDISGSMEWLKAGEHLPFRVKGEVYWFYSDIPVRNQEKAKELLTELPESCSIAQIHDHKPYASHIHLACKKETNLNTLGDIIGNLIEAASAPGGIRRATPA